MRKEIEEAVALLETKEPQALERALELLQGTVYSFSMKVCGQREDAEDTMQEVLVKAMPYLAKFESPRALLVWLYRVAKNRCLMSRRKSKFAPKQELSLDELMPDRTELARLKQEGPVNPEVLAIRGEQAKQVREVIHKLAPEYRIVLVLRDMEGLTDEEVAEITGLRAGTVRVRLHRARLFVRKGLVQKSNKRRAGEKRIAAQESLVPGHPRQASCKTLFAQLSDYLDEQLDVSLCDELEKHLKGCGPCESFLGTLEATIKSLRQLPPESFDKAHGAKLRRELLAKFPVF